MRVSFLVERPNYYRLFGPIVDRALERGWGVECWHDASARGPKGWKSPDEEVAAFRHGHPLVRRYDDSAGLAALLAATPPEVVIAMRRSNAAETGSRTRWFGLQYTLDIADLVEPDGRTRYDGIGLHSAWWRDHAADCLRINVFNRAQASGRDPQPLDEAAVAETLTRRATLVGIPEMDQCHWIDPWAVRERIGLERDRPVVLYIPFPFKSNPSTFWVREVYGRSSALWSRVAIALAGRHEYASHVARRWNDRSVVTAVRAFCDRNGAALVVKARAKDPVPGYLERAADRVFYDEAYYPATILELMKISALCVHCFSTVSYEAAYAGVPSICVAPNEDDLGFPTPWQAFLNIEAGSTFNFPGVVYARRLGEFLDTFAAAQLSDYLVDPVARAQYVEKFIGFDDGKSSDRFLDAVQSLVERGQP